MSCEMPSPPLTGQMIFALLSVQSGASGRDTNWLSATEGPNGDSFGDVTLDGHFDLDRLAKGIMAHLEAKQ